MTRGPVARTLLRLAAAVFVTGSCLLIAQSLRLAGLTGPVRAAVLAVVLADLLISWLAVEIFQYRRRRTAALARQAASLAWSSEYRPGEPAAAN